MPVNHAHPLWKYTPSPYWKLLRGSFIQRKAHPLVKIPSDNSFLARNSPPCKIAYGRFSLKNFAKNFSIWITPSSLIGFSILPEMTPSVNIIFWKSKHVEKSPWINPLEHLLWKIWQRECKNKWKELCIVILSNPLCVTFPLEYSAPGNRPLQGRFSLWESTPCNPPPQKKKCLYAF